MFTFSKVTEAQGGKTLPEVCVDGDGLQVLKFRRGQEHSGGADGAAERAGAAPSTGPLDLHQHINTGFC